MLFSVLSVSSVVKVVPLLHLQKLLTIEGKENT
jgi:hypothetical protein